MDLLDIIILSIVEGITEFLPISSTGHLILTSRLLNLESTNFLKTFEIAIQLGAILAVVSLYTRTLIGKIDLIKKILIAFIPTVVCGFLVYPFLKEFLLESVLVTTIALFVGGLVLILIEKILAYKKSIPPPSDEISYKQAALIGLCQSLSIIPGVSRAAATIVGGLLMGVRRDKATEFSFLLAIPTMFAATGYDFYKSQSQISSENLYQIILGMALSFLFAYISVKFLINYVKRHDFSGFGVYRIIVSVVFWIIIAISRKP